MVVPRAGPREARDQGREPAGPGPAHGVGDDLARGRRAPAPRAEDTCEGDGGGIRNVGDILLAVEKIW